MPDLIIVGSNNGKLAELQMSLSRRGFSCTLSAYNEDIAEYVSHQSPDLQIKPSARQAGRLKHVCHAVYPSIPHVHWSWFRYDGQLHFQTYKTSKDHRTGRLNPHPPRTSKRLIERKFCFLLPATCGKVAALLMEAAQTNHGRNPRHRLC